MYIAVSQAYWWLVWVLVWNEMSSGNTNIHNGDRSTSLHLCSLKLWKWIFLLWYSLTIKSPNIQHANEEVTCVRWPKATPFKRCLGIVICMAYKSNTRIECFSFFFSFFCVYLFPLKQYMRSLFDLYFLMFRLEIYIEGQEIKVVARFCCNYMDARHNIQTILFHKQKDIRKYVF